MEQTQTLLPEHESHYPRTDWLSQLRQKFSPSAAGTRIAARLHERTVQAYLSPAAMSAASTLTAPLTIEMELYFSCFVRKAVRFHAQAPNTDCPSDSYTLLQQNLHLQFRPVTTQHCSMASCDEAPPMESMPVTRPQAFLPRWVSIDYQHGQWLGEFGY